MSAYKRTDPGKLARDREAIQKSQASMNHPDHPAFEAIRGLFSALERKVARNANEGAIQRDFGAPYGPSPLKTGAEVQGKPEVGTTIGAYVLGKKKTRSIT
jgi:hypothetical protein